MSLDRDAVQRGYADEDKAAAWFRSRGWTVEVFGQRAWAPGIIAALGETEGPLRHAPDLLIARDGQVRLVEVMRNREPFTRAVEVAKLTAMTEWSRMAPAFYLDAATGRSWWHDRQWHANCLTDVRRIHGGRGSGDPYVLQGRGDEGPPPDDWPPDA